MVSYLYSDNALIGFDGRREHHSHVAPSRKLPLLVQFGLLLAVLEVIDKAGEFMGDVTGEDVPQSYPTGVQLLLWLPYALTAIIDAKGMLDDEDDEPPRV